MVLSIMSYCFMDTGFSIENPDFPMYRMHGILCVFAFYQSRKSLYLCYLGLVIYVFLLVPSTKSDSLFTTFPISIKLTKLYSKSLSRRDLRS